MLDTTIAKVLEEIVPDLVSDSHLLFIGCTAESCVYRLPSIRYASVCSLFLL